ncbi:MAG: serine/threonine protein kinase and signal transduction histidine kinase (STHK) with GAF and, partial [bacterium]
MVIGDKAFDKLELDYQAKELGAKSSTKSGRELLALYDSTIARLYNFDKISERFVGRDEELNKLNNFAQVALNGQGKPVFIIGDPGIGKTELVNQFFNAKNLPELRENAQANILTGRYFDIGKNNSYKVFLDGFYRTISQLEKQNFSDELVLKKIKTLSTYLQEVKDLSSSVFLQESDKERTKYKSFELLAQNYELLSSIFPIVLFLDDLQWADELGLEFLAYLIRAMQGKPLFLVCTVRERELFVENHPLRTWMRSMSRYNSYEQIKLRPFTESETEFLISRIFSAHNFTEATTTK